MYKVLTAAAVLAPAAAVAPAASAQAGKRPLPVCTPSGYAPPIYATYGANGGGGNFAYEVGSVCTPQAVKDVAEAVGMGRYIPMGLKGVSTIIWTAKGTLADAKGKLQPVDKLDVQMNYYLPAVRIAVTTGAAKPMIEVFNDGQVWSEETEGVGNKPLPPARGDELFAMLKMTPFGGVWSAVEAEGHATVSTVKGKPVISGASPYDKIEVATTIMAPGKVVGLKPELSQDAKNLPESVSFKLGGHSYVGTFSDYRYTWESDYRVIWPAHLVWTKDGKPFADLTTTYFHSNPYVMFPPPETPTKVASK